MTEAEYNEKLSECITFKKWQVIVDAAKALIILDNNYDVIFNEVRAERQAIVKMLNSNVSNKQKLDFVKSFAEDWKGEG